MRYGDKQKENYSQGCEGVYLFFYAAKASRMFVNATLHNLELNIGNLATSACMNWMIYLQPIRIEYMKKEMKNRRRTCSDCMTRSSILESVST